MRRAAALITLVLAGGISAVGSLGPDGGHPAITGAALLNARSVASVPRPGSADGAAAALPVPVGGPVQALVPMRPAKTGEAVKPASRRTPSGHTASPPAAQASPVTAPAPSAQPSSSPTPPSPSAPSAPAAGGGTCANPSFTTSAPFGSWDQGPYTVANNMWNIGGGGVSQTLSACSASDWFVNATVADDGGGVKTYPNSHYTFARPPQISSLSAVTSTFAQASPASGTFEDAYDIWLNALAGSGNEDEVMIWTENHGQIPGGSPAATATIDGASYTVWRGANNLVSFVANATVTSGTLNLLPFFQWLLRKGWEPAGSTLVQVDYGVEIVSTNSAPQTFGFSDFSVSSS